jgi:hypothetical protein
MAALSGQLLRWLPDLRGVGGGREGRGGGVPGGGCRLQIMYDLQAEG